MFACEFCRHQFLSFFERERHINQVHLKANRVCDRCHREVYDDEIHNIYCYKYQNN